MSRLLAAAALALLLPLPCLAQRPFGTLPGGEKVTEYTLRNAKGMTVKVMDYGATITEIQAPDRNGKFENITLGFDRVEDYLTDKNQYFGCTTGRVANRVAKGKFTVDGKEYQLAINNGPNTLHGGTKRPLAKVLWKATKVHEVRGPNGVTASDVTFNYQSPDGEEGFPGNLDVTVKFTLDAESRLLIEYKAVTDKATPVNLTNHAYFNLAGAGAPSVLDHTLMVNADAYTPADKELIPTGKIEPVAGTPFDFRQPKRIGRDIGSLLNTPAMGYDHCFVLNGKRAPGQAELAAVLRDPSSGRVLTCLTDQPGVQVYTGNFLKGNTGKGGKAYPQRSAVCLETFAFTNSMNTPGFPDIILRPGQTYQQVCIYGFSVDSSAR
jgi:aldose 1-epimerase